MSSLERKREKHSPFTLNPDPRMKTSAEIVTEARHSLRTLRTQRPFTPRDDHRQLFGETSRAQDGRPPSTFRLRIWLNALSYNPPSSSLVSHPYSVLNEHGLFFFFQPLRLELWSAGLQTGFWNSPVSSGICGFFSSLFISYPHCWTVH